MNEIPKDARRVYFLGVCGTGMGSLAGLLKERGFTVAGSDQNVYPPMSDELSRRRIPVFAPYDAENLRSFRPELVIVGNALSRGNPEVEFMLASGVAFASMPQALNRYFLSDREVVVVAGTHGKTTTTALIAYLLDRLGEDPSYLVGGVCRDLGASFHTGSGRLFVIEGDEYDTAFFDKGPKFLHYNPRHVIMTSLEFDHADIYRDLAHMAASFVALGRIIPAGGSLHLCGAYPRLEEAVAVSKAPARRYGFDSPDWELRDYAPEGSVSRFNIFRDGRKVVELASPMNGRHNALNVAAAFSVIETLSLDLEKAARALKGFSGIKRRQEIVADDGRLAVIDDFAHHPTAVAETIAAVRERYPGRRLVAVFEPRSNTSMRDVFQREFAEAFSLADEILLAPVFNPAKVPAGRVLDVPRLVGELRRLGRTAESFFRTEDIIARLVNETPKPAVALIMSNGGFENIHRRLWKTWDGLKK